MQKASGETGEGLGKRWLKPPETSSSSAGSTGTLTGHAALSGYSGGRWFSGARDSLREEERRWSRGPL